MASGMSRVVAPCLLAGLLITVAGSGCLGDESQKPKAPAADSPTEDAGDDLVPDAAEGIIPDEPAPAELAPVQVFWFNYTAPDELPEQPIVPEDDTVASVRSDGQCGILGTGLELRLFGVRLGGC